MVVSGSELVTSCRSAGVTRIRVGSGPLSGPPARPSSGDWNDLHSASTTGHRQRPFLSYFLKEVGRSWRSLGVVMAVEGELRGNWPLVDYNRSTSSLPRRT